MPTIDVNIPTPPSEAIIDITVAELQALQTGGDIDKSKWYRVTDATPPCLVSGASVTESSAFAILEGASDGAGITSVGGTGTYKLNTGVFSYGFVFDSVNQIIYNGVDPSANTIGLGSDKIIIEVGQNVSNFVLGDGFRLCTIWPNLNGNKADDSAPIDFITGVTFLYNRTSPWEIRDIDRTAELLFLYVTYGDGSDPEEGWYDPSTDIFTPIAGGSAAWGGITGTLASQTDLQTALDGKVDENVAITGATKTKITYDSKGLVTSGADATTADIADSTNKRYVTDANLTVIGNTSGTNTGDNATNSQYSGLATSKQDISTIVTGSLTAVNDARYIQTASATYTDPTPVQGKGYQIAVIAGTATVGGVAYAQVGTIIYRYYNSLAWVTTFVRNRPMPYQCNATQNQFPSSSTRFGFISASFGTTFTSSSVVVYYFAKGGTFSGARWRTTSSSQPASGSLVITLMTGSDPTALSASTVVLTVAASAVAGVVTSANTVTINDGDYVCWRFVNNATASSINVADGYIEFLPNP